MNTKPSVSFNDDFKQLIDLVPLCLDPGKDFCVRAVVDGEEFASGNFRGHSLIKSFPIHANKCQVGAIDLFDRKHMQGLDNPLSACEQGRILALADLMGRLSSRRLFEKQILEYLFIEQNRIGQYLHDNLCQHLTGLAFMIQLLELDLTDQSADEAKKAADVANIIDLVSLAISQTRGLADMLGTGSWGGNNVTNELQEMASRFEKLFNISCRFKSEQTVYIEQDEIARRLCYVCQEAIRHAIQSHCAKEIEIGLSKIRGKITLRVDYAISANRCGGHSEDVSLGIMKLLAEHIGAKLKIAYCKENCKLTLICHHQ